VGHNRILLVEDDRLVRMNLVLILERDGYRLDTAACAAEAYERLGRDHYDLVLADIGLPDSNGFEVLRAVKRADPSTKVVLVTGSQTALTSEEAVGQGAECLLLKPFALADLMATVHRFTRV
jgi:DNA-binding response OmpR family regulator